MARLFRVAGATAVAVGALWIALQPSRWVVEEQEFRRLYLLQRLDGYGWLLVAAGAACALLGVACRPDAEAPRPASAVFSPPTMAVLVAALALAAAGLSHREWVRFDRPCWDHYCGAGRWIASWLGGESSTEVLRDRMNRWPHANSFVAPALMAAANRLTGIDVLPGYRALAGVSTVAALYLLHRGVLRRLHADRAVVWTAWWLAAAHTAVLRSSLFPQTDAMAMLCVTALLALALSERFWTSAARQAAALLVVVTGLFVKLSFYPALALLPVSVAVLRPRGDRRGLLAASARALVLGAVPVALFLAVSYGLGFLDNLQAELQGRTAEKDSAPAVVAEALVKALVPFAPWIWLGSRDWNERDRTLAAWAGVFLVTFVASQAAGLLRYHLVGLPAYAGLSVRGLSVLQAQSGDRALAAVATGMTALSVLSLLLNTYN